MDGPEDLVSGRIQDDWSVTNLEPGLTDIEQAAGHEFGKPGSAERAIERRFQRLVTLMPIGARWNRYFPNLGTPSLV